VVKSYFVYLLASRRNGTLYCGVTNNLVRRIWEHRNDQTPGFTSKYAVHMLVWYEEHHCIHEAIQRETRIKGWLRDWKIALIEKTNPQWRDLYESLLPGPLRNHTDILPKTIIPPAESPKGYPDEQSGPSGLE
jgi:putative endonuclease